MARLNLNGKIADILEITLGKQYHLIRPLARNDKLFLYLMPDRAKANLAMARRESRVYEKTLDFLSNPGYTLTCERCAMARGSRLEGLPGRAVERVTTIGPAAGDTTNGPPQACAALVGSVQAWGMHYPSIQNE